MSRRKRKAASLEPPPLADFGLAFFIFVRSFAATPKAHGRFILFLEGESSNRMRRRRALADDGRSHAERFTGATLLHLASSAAPSDRPDRFAVGRRCALRPTT